MKSNRELIDEAIYEKRVLHIEYLDCRGNATYRDVSPLEWEGADKFRAWCHLRTAERHFRVDRIQACRVSDVSHRGPGSSERHKTGQRDSQPQSNRSRRGSTGVGFSTRKRSVKARRESPGRRFTKVVEADQWSRLLQYYRECLIRENQQQYIIENDQESRFFFRAERNVIHQFLEGRVSLEFDLRSGRSLSGVVSFVRSARGDRSRQLCLGYPVFWLTMRKMAPLVFAPVTVEEQDDELRLLAEDPQPSYAVFDELGMSQEELATLLEECAETSATRDEPDVQQWEEFLVDRLSHLLDRPIEANPRGGPMAMSLYVQPCLFWANPSIFTRSLIGELTDLAAESRWSSVPTPLRHLLTNVAEHHYPEPAAPEQDDTVYVTEVNEEQRKTLAAVEDENVVVVTGPPGTGKSQTILNIVAQAVLRGQSVLFASRNNQAVDVVMDRLASELRFPGAIRTGGRLHRLAAAREMEATLNRISTGTTPRSAESLRRAYSDLREEAKQAESTLHQVRELNGLLRSQKAERESVAQLLPDSVRDLADAHAPSYSTRENDHLQQVLASLLTTAFEARDEVGEIESDLRSFVADDESRGPVLESLHKFQDQWGAFGGGFLRCASFDTLESLEGYVETWLKLLETFEARARIDARARLLRKWQASSLRRPDEFPLQLKNEITSLAADLETGQLSSALQEAKSVAERAKDLQDGKQPFIERSLTWLGLRDPVSDMTSHLVALRQSVGIKQSVEVEAMKDVSELLLACERTVSFLSASLYQSGLEEARGMLRAAEEAYDGIAERLPETLQNDVAKLQVSELDTDLMSTMEDLLSRVRSLVKRRDELAAAVNAKLDANEDGLEMLSAFHGSPAGDDDVLWRLRIPVSLEVIVSHLTKWQHLLSLWEAGAVVDHLREQLDAVPDEQQAVEAIRTLKKKLFQGGAELVRVRWLERVRDASTDVLQQAGRYASAVRQLSERYDPETYANLRCSQEDNFHSALLVFPIWATTNLSAKSNLPLDAELFDIVVVDEASQCDVPSALPLLYRGKQVVVIGDPNQLRHIASLYEESDLDSAAAFNVSPDTFLYNRTSLFDLARASVGTKPGTIMLKEHYRSHRSIVEFSNNEFYDGELVVRTDLKQRNVPEPFLKDGCGAFWVDVPGEAHRPSGGSAFNPTELQALRQVLPRLLDSLSRYDENEYPFSIGIVTPFREQSRRVKNLLKRSLGEDTRVSAGTAHTFQGDERDIVLLSPVLGPGLPQGTLRWLNDTKNLLNVAVTRARLQLIVLGGWEYCADLPPSSIYRRLADWLEPRVIPDFEHLPNFGGKPFGIAGTIIYGTESARLTLRRYLSESCRDFVWWMDRYFEDPVLRLFWSVFQQPEVEIDEVRLLTSRQQLQDSRGRGAAFHLGEIKATQSELQRRGVDLEVRVLPKKELPHDRYLYSRGQSLNMPPFGGAYGEHKHVSEYTRSSTGPDFFEQYWDRADEL